MANEEVQSFTSNSTSSSSIANQLENVKVAVRLRPFTEKEKQKNNRRIVDIEQNTVVLYNPNYGDVSLKKFTFDYSYWSYDGYKKDANGVNIPDLVHPNNIKYVGQEKVFEDLGQFLLNNALKGYNSALLAYGPTGSGKSYTVSGYGRNEGILPRFARALFVELDKKAKSLIEHPNGESDSKSSKSKDEAADSKNCNRYEVYFSMIEIHNEVVRDLLAKMDAVTQSTIVRRGLKVREHPKYGFFVENLTSYACADKDEIEQRIEEGQLNKSIAATSMNETSSRGHTIYEFKIKQYKLKSSESPEEILTTSVVQLVDLAGSERMAVHVTGQLGQDSFIASRSNSPYPIHGNEKSTRNVGSTRVASSSSASNSNSNSSSTTTTTTSANQFSTHSKRNAQNSNLNERDYKQRFKESVSINQSLSVLGKCIQVMSIYSQQLESGAQTRRSAPKIPYRDSVLTKLLNRCCLSGNSKVVIIATLSPVDSNYEDTLSTLRFSDRAKRIRTHARVNRMSRSEVVGSLQKENERLKQIVDGRVTRSDDSSQTSNFDDNENVMENFTGSKINLRANKIDIMATPSRSRTTVRKNREHEQNHRNRSLKSPSRIASSTSNPSLLVREQMKRLVSPASRKLIDTNGKSLQKSRSIGQGLTSKLSDKALAGYDYDDIDLKEMNTSDEVDLNDIKEGLMSPDSDDSFSALASEGLSNEDKIGIINRLLSNSSAFDEKMQNMNENKPNRSWRPKKGNGMRAGFKQVSVLSSSLKKSNPYLSNLNPDEQLTGMISYIIKQGVTVVGKSNDCDIVLHGPELRAKHAKILRFDETNPEKFEQKTSTVYIEPIFDANEVETFKEKDAVITVNGSPIINKTRLYHCDRILFGTNAYFVFSNNLSKGKSSGETVADLDMVTFDMARNEVLKKVMAEAENEAVIKEIKDYTHRPGTGKHKVKSEESKEKSTIDPANLTSVKDTRVSRLTRSLTIHDQKDESGQLDEDAIITRSNRGVETKPKKVDEEAETNELEKQEAIYRDQLMDDTYEYAMPIAEVNAVAKEMGIKVSYGLKILTGEEQLSDQAPSSCLDSNTSDGSSMGDNSNDNERAKIRSANQVSCNERSTQLTKIDCLDIPPALYIKLHLEEYDMDFYWSKDKFQARRYKILELYGAWDLGGKSGLVEYLIDQSKSQGEYLIDPFIDDPVTTSVLIGHAQVTLQPLTHLSDMKETYDILDLNDETVGSIFVQAVPCYEEEVRYDDENSDPYKPYNEEDISKQLLDSPDDLLNRKLIFMLRIISCRSLPDKFFNISCQYSLGSDSNIIKTKVLREDSSESEHGENENSDELLFDHSHFIYIEKVTDDILNFFQHGFLTILIVGQYKLSEPIMRSPTLISTIINSINKYKQQHLYNNINYSGNNYYNSSTISTKSHRDGVMNSNSGASSAFSTSATLNLFDQQNEDDEASNSVNGLSQENIIDMILTRRKLDRAENQLHYIKRTVNIAEHYNKKHIPVKTVKKLLNSNGHELDNENLEEIASNVAFKEKSPGSKNSGCIIQ